jgi:6-phosphogluconolactonase
MNIPHEFPTAESSADAASAFILDTLRAAIDARGRASIAVSGGHTPRLLFDRMSQADFPWRQLQFFFVDERAVPPTDTDSNFHLANEHLLIPVRFPPGNIHRIPGELDPAEAAAAYTGIIREVFGLNAGELPIFDVIQHGMGGDGHTASLFPGEPLIGDRSGIAAAVHAPARPTNRITLLPGVLLASRASVFVLNGEDKRASLQQVLTGPCDPLKFPSQLLSRSGKRVDWFVSRLGKVEWPPP